MVPYTVGCLDRQCLRRPGRCTLPLQRSAPTTNCALMYLRSLRTNYSSLLGEHLQLPALFLDLVSRDHLPMARMRWTV